MNANSRLRPALDLAVIMATALVSGCSSLPSGAEALADLAPRTSQAIVVEPDAAVGHLAVLRAWERSGGEWHAFGDAIAVTLGRNGAIAGDEKREGDGCTPAGVHRLGIAFGYAPTCSTGLAYRQAKPDDYWIDDVDSPQYNQWVEGHPSVSCERLRRDDDQYELAAVVEWNTAPVQRGRGSAIFVHVWKAPGTATSGCVAMARADLERLLGWLDRRAEPVLVVRTVAGS